jgi:hypothetical protein
VIGKYPASTMTNNTSKIGYKEISQKLGYQTKNEFSYVDWLNASREENPANLAQVTAHQASMIQKYSVPGSNHMIESKYYLSPRAQLGTPLTPVIVPTMSLMGHNNERQIMSPPDLNSNAILIKQNMGYGVLEERLDSSNLDIQSY